MARPLTHDLMTDIFSELDVRVQRIVITELKDSTYFAELVLSFGDKVMIFDSRPSDAIALSLRASAPIFVMKEVLDQAQITFAQASQDAEKAVESSSEEVPVEAETPDTVYPDRDFKSIDKEKWTEVLEDLDPDDFKYKT
jgi:bifunctional DNase/RNase